MAITVFRDPAFNAPTGIIAAVGAVWFTNIGSHSVGRIHDGVIATFSDPDQGRP